MIQTLKENFGIDINHYLEVDFKSFQEIVDTIGYVRVYLPGRTRDEETGLQHSRTGVGATRSTAPRHSPTCGRATCRSRIPRARSSTPRPASTGACVDARNSDLDRIARQQTFIRKLAGLAISKSLSDPFLAVELADNVLGYIKADEGLSRDDVNALVRSFKTVDVNDPNSVRFETLPVEQYEPDPNRLVASPDADAMIEQLRTFGDNTPKPATVPPSQVKVRVTDATGTNVGQSVVVAARRAMGFQATAATAARTIVPVTEVRYGYGLAEEAKALLPYFPDAKLVPDPKVTGAVQLVLGASFPGAITVPSTSTTTPPSTVPGAPVTTAPPPTTTTLAPAATDPCP